MNTKKRFVALSLAIVTCASSLLYATAPSDWHANAMPIDDSINLDDDSSVIQWVTDISKTAKITLSGTSFAYTGQPICPKVSVRRTPTAVKDMVEGTQYTVKYENNVNPGTATVIVTGIRNFKGTVKTTFEITQPPAPAVVSGFKASATNASAIKLTWNKVSDADGYIVYRYNTSTKKYGRIAKGGNLAFTDKNLKPGTSYKYAIRAYKNIDGKDILSPTYPQITATTNPANVSGFKAASVSANAIKLKWNKTSGADGYIVYRYNTSTKKYVRIAKGKNLTFTNKKLKSGTTYKYAIRAYKIVNGKDVLSKSYPQITVSTNPATVSFKVTGGVRKALVQWSKVTGATGYKVYYKTSAKGKWIGLKTTNNKTTSYTKTGLKKGRTYYFAVKAYRTVGGKTYNGAFNTKAVKVK